MKKTVVVTGAGSGIGRSIAMELAERNYRLVLLGRDSARLKQTQSALTNPDEHCFFGCDIQDAKSIRKALESMGADSLYGLIANAGIGGENIYGPEDRWEQIVSTNLTGSYYSVHECLPYLKNTNEGYKKIIFISSILARLGVPGYSAYCASKAGLLGLCRSLAQELSGDKILVNAICPGWVNTQMAHEGIQGFADALSISKEEAFNKAMEVVPLGKMSEPEEVAKLTGFLMSEDQSSFTGQTIDINNGALMD